MERVDTDLGVIGAGSGGLSVAAGAVQMGARVVLIEAGEMGGDCLNHGCVPSKALIAAARAGHAQAHPGIAGIAPVAPQVDFAAVMGHVRGVIAAIAPTDSQERFERLGVRVIRARARFVSDREVEAGGVRVRARRFVLATGSRPLVPEVPGLAAVPFLTNETVFALRERPGHLIVMGCGPVGVELAQAFRRLGSRVTLIEAGRALGRDDPEAAALVLGRLRGEGVEIVEGAPVERVSPEAAGIRVEADGRRWTGSHLLVAAGRAPNVEDIGLEAAGIAHDRNGVRVGADLRTTNRRVYAVGDVAGPLRFTHVASYHAALVVRPILFGLPARVRQDHIPRVTYTEPELAQIGPTEAEARALHGGRLTAVRVDYADNDRARTDARGEGWAKAMVVGGRPVGVTIVGAEAGELVGLWSLAIANRLPLRAVTSMVAPYPTLSDLNKRLAGAYFSPKLFDTPRVKRVVRLVQRLVP